MASDTVPAAAGDPAPVPAPPPHAPTTGIAPASNSPGGLAGLLAAVEPARPTGFTIDPTLATPADSDGVLPAGASSDAFHTTSDPTNGPGIPGNGSSRQDTGIIRAWLLAGAERWRKGAEARNKALDIQKEKAKALQVKEARTTTVNRSEKLVGGSTSTGTNTQAKTDKNTGNRTSTHNSGNGPGGANSGRGSGGRGTSNHGSGNAGRTNGGRGSAHGGHGSSGGTGSGTGGRGSGSGGAGRNNADDSGRRRKQDRTDSGSGSAGRHPGSGGRHGGGTSSSAPGASRNGSDISRSSNGTDNQRTHTPRQGRDTTTTSTCGDSSGIDKKPSKKTPSLPDNTPTPGTSTGGGQGTAKNGPGKTKKQPKVVIDTEGNDASKPGPPPAAGATEKNAPRPGGPQIDTQGAREAGYRDGSRIGRIEAQVGAYRDGVRDGRGDIKEAAAREKARLDKAHAARKNPPAPQPTGPAFPPKPTHPPRPTQPPSVGQPPAEPAKTSNPPATKPKPETADPTDTPAQGTPVSLTKDTPTTPPKPVGPKGQPSTPAASSGKPAPRTDQDAKDTTVPAPTAQPIQVTGVNAGYVDLGDGADRGRISTGEVRTLKAFERKLGAKADIMLQVYDAGCEIKAHATEQLKQIIWWTEQAKVVDGGDDLIATLTQLEEAATDQLHKAEEICKRAARSNDSCRALLANVEIRYGSIYKAVVDANRDKPAFMSYYQETASA